MRAAAASGLPDALRRLPPGPMIRRCARSRCDMPGGWKLHIAKRKDLWPRSPTRRQQRRNRLRRLCLAEWQRYSNHRRVSLLWRQNRQLPPVVLNDFAADRQAEAQTDVARGVERFGHFLQRFGTEPRAIVLDIDVDPTRAP